MWMFSQEWEEAGRAVIPDFSGGWGRRMASWLEEGVVLVRETRFAVCWLCLAGVSEDTSRAESLQVAFFKILTATFQTKRRRQNGDLVSWAVVSLVTLRGVVRVWDQGRSRAVLSEWTLIGKMNSLFFSSISLARDFQFY